MLLLRVRIGASYTVFPPLNPQVWEMDTRACWREAGCRLPSKGFRNTAPTQGDCDVGEGPPGQPCCLFTVLAGKTQAACLAPFLPSKAIDFSFLPLFYLWLLWPLTIALYLQTREPAVRISSRASSVPAGLGHTPFRTLWPFRVPMAPSESFQSLSLSALTGRKLLFVR